MHLVRRHFLQTLAAVLGGAIFGAAAQSFPTKPVILMVPYPAGGLSDNIARKIGPQLTQAVGQPVIVENAGGAAGTIAAQKVLGAPADGYMVYQGSPNELILAPLVIPGIKFKPQDWRPVHRIAIAPMAIFTRGGLPVKSVDELAALAAKRAKEGSPLTYASVGVGSLYHLLGAKMSKDLGTAMTHVPYKGAADATRDLASDMVDIFITPYNPGIVEFVKQGKMKAVAVLSEQAQPLLPGVVSVATSKSLSSFLYAIPTGYFVKRDTPDAVVEVLRKGFQKALADKDVRAGLVAMSVEPAQIQTPDEADKAFKDEIAKYQAIAKEIGLKPGD